MQLQPTFSIITITYNAVRLVEQTLLNVLSQSYPNIEYIVIDGGSTDGTVDIIRRYESGLAYWVSEPDKGIYDAMNKGLQKATGDYVWFINAGDTLCSSDTVQSADFDWCIRCMKQARSFCNTHLTLSDFLDGGTSTTQRKASLRERYAIMCKYYGTFVTVLLHGWFAIRFYTAKCLKGRV